MTNEYLKEKGLVLVNLEHPTIAVLESYNLDVAMVKNITDGDSDHGAYIVLKPIKDKDLLLMVQNSKGKIYFHHSYPDMFKYHNVDYHVRNDAIKDIEQPNYIGVFTPKKVQDWIEYCIWTFDMIMQTVSANDEGNKKIENDIQEFIKASKGTSNGYGKRTTVYTKHFEVTFEHTRETASVYTKVIFRGNIQDVINIEKLF